VLAVGLAWFAARRYGEAGRELRRRKIAESQLAAALVDNRRLAQEYVRLQEAEQKRLARELHDELGQYLNVIKLDAVAIRDGRLADSAGLRERAEAIVANGNHVHTALTSLIRQLRPVGLDELGLEAALEHCVDTWRPRLPGVQLSLELAGFRLRVMMSLRCGLPMTELDLMRWRRPRAWASSACASGSPRSRDAWR
jgi:two-component system sensor histidine kinase UhpB